MERHCDAIFVVTVHPYCVGLGDMDLSVIFVDMYHDKAIQYDTRGLVVVIAT